MSTARRRRSYVDIGLVVLAVVLVLTTIGTADRVTTDELDQREALVLGAFRDDDFTRVVIERGREKIELVRTAVDEDGDAIWTIKQPFEEEAEYDSVDDYLTTFEFAEAKRRIKPDEVDRARMGLERPAARIQLTMGKITYRIAIGGSAVEPKDSVYAELTGTGVPNPGVVIIAKSVADEMNAKVDMFRAKEVMPYLSTALARIVIAGASGERKLRRASWGGWRFDGIQNDYRVNREALDFVLTQFARIEADSFIDVAVAKKAQAKAPTVRVTMVPKKKGSPVGVVVVGGTCPTDAKSAVALREKPDPVAACVPGNVMAGLETKAEHLVDRGLFTLRDDEIESIVVSAGKKVLSLDRSGEGWVLTKPQKAELDAESGNQRVKAVLQAKGELIPSPDFAALGLKPPAVKIELRGATMTKDAKVEEVHVSQPDGDGAVYVRRLHDDAVIKVPQNAARALAPDASLVRSRKLLDYRASRVLEVAVEGAGIKQRVKRDGEGGFTLVAPKGFVADGSLAADLMSRVSTLAADHWVRDDDDGSFGLAKPTLRVSAEIEQDDEKTKTHELIIGGRTSGGYFGSLTTDPGVFVLPKAAYDAMTLLLIDRTVTMMDPAEVTSIRLKSADRGVQLQKEGSRFTQADSGPALPDDRIASIIEGLSTLRADVAVHTGAAKPAEGFASPVLRINIEREPARGERSEPVELLIGSGDSWRGTAVYYARRKGMNATFVVARSKVQPILDAL